MPKRVTVAATTKAGNRAYYSNYGSMVEISAPGGSADGSDTNILSTVNNSTTSPNAAGYALAKAPAVAAAS